MCDQSTLASSNCVVITDGNTSKPVTLAPILTGKQSQSPKPSVVKGWETPPSHDSLFWVKATANSPAVPYGPGNTL